MTLQELRRQFHAISELRSEIKSLQSDNLKLYEKVRYMQSYRETSSVSQLDPLPGTSSSSSNSNSRRDGKSRVVGGAGDGADADEVKLGRWRQRYEETMNPFEAFRGRVRTSGAVLSHLFSFSLLLLDANCRKRRKHTPLCHSRSVSS